MWVDGNTHNLSIYDKLSYDIIFQYKLHVGEGKLSFLTDLPSTYTILSQLYQISQL